MDQPGDARRVAPRELAAAAAVGVAPVLVLLVLAVAQLGDDHVPFADWAVLELQTRATLGGDNLLGPYSRFGFHHPGPAMFAWLAPFYALAGQRFSGMVVGTVVLQAVALAGFVAVLGAAFGRRAAWLAALVVLVFTWRFGLERFRDPWNPYWVVVPLAVTGAAAAAAWRRPARWPAVVAVAAASVAGQSHLGVLPVAAVLAGLAALGVVASAAGAAAGGSGGRVSAAARALAPAVVVGALLWAPPVWEQLTREPGNVGTTLSTLRQDAPPQSRREVVHLVVSALSWGPAPLGDAFGPTSPERGPLRAGAGEVAVVGLSGASLVALAVAAGRRRDRAGVALAVVPLAAAGLAVVAGTQVREQLWPYLFTGSVGTSLLWWAAVVVGLARLPAVRAGLAARPRAAAPVAAMVLALAVVAGSWSQLERAGTPFAERFASPQVDAFMAGEAGRWCRHDQPVLVAVGSGRHWGEAMALGASLARCGVPVRFEESWRFMAGDAFTIRPEEVGRTAVTLVLASSEQPPAPGDERLASRPPFALDRRP